MTSNVKLWKPAALFLNRFSLKTLTLKGVADSPYVKLIRKDRTHNGFLLREGLNRLKLGEFNENPDCGPGGLYFCKEEDIGRWLYLYDSELGYVAQVTLCRDSKVVTMDEKLKTDKFILGPFQPFGEYLTRKKALAVVRKCGTLLHYVPKENKTRKLCLAAVQQDGRALEFVPDEFKSPELCLSAVQENGWALEYAPDERKTPELCKIAVQQKGPALQFVPEESKTLDVCVAAIKRYIPALQYVPKELAPELFIFVVPQNGWALKFVPEKHRTPELCKIAVQQNWRALQYVPIGLMTPELCRVAVQQDGGALIYVPDKFKMYAMDAIHLKVDTQSLPSPSATRQ